MVVNSLTIKLEENIRMMGGVEKIYVLHRSGFRVPGFGFRVSGYGIRGAGYGISNFEFRMH